ncbi:hypothetical protein AB0N02_22630, partial [Streptosporangium sp. NPDC051022]
VVEVAGRQGEAAWGMPLPEELRKGLDSPAPVLIVPGQRGSRADARQVTFSFLDPRICILKAWRRSPKTKSARGASSSSV